MWKEWIQTLYPRICIGCEEVLPETCKYICMECFHDLPYTYHFHMSQNLMSQQFYGRLPLESSASLLYFYKNGISQELIHTLKYRNQPEIGSYLVRLFNIELMEHHSKYQFDCIVPIPLHPKKKNERGYNQLTDFGKALAQLLNIPFYEKLLHRRVYTKTQTFKDIVQRFRYENSTFGIDNQPIKKNTHILLIDDVCTTGSTIENAGKVLCELPNIRLSVLCMSMAIT